MVQADTEKNLNELQNSTNNQTNANPEQLAESNDAIAPGELLKKTRESKGLTQKNIAQTLHLLPAYVEALENGNYKIIPSTAFVKGYMRSYATYLGLDANQLIAKLPPEYQLERVFQKIDQSAMRKMNLQKLVFIFISLIFVAGLIGLTIYWSQLRGDKNANSNGAYELKEEGVQNSQNVLTPIQDETEQEKLQEAENLSEPQTAQDEQTNPENQNSSNQIATPNKSQIENLQDGANLPDAKQEVALKPAKVVKPANVAKIANPNNLDLNSLSKLNGGTFILSFVGECWLQATDADGRNIITTTGNKGDLIKIAGKKPISLILGKGANARANYKGEVFDLAPFTGESVARVKIR